MNRDYIAISKHEIKTSLNDCLDDGTKLNDYVIIKKDVIKTAFINKDRNGNQCLAIIATDDSVFYVYPNEENSEKELLTMLKKTLNILNASETDFVSNIESAKKKNALEYKKRVLNKYFLEKLDSLLIDMDKHESDKEKVMKQIQKDCLSIVNVYSIDDEETKEKYAQYLAEWLVTEQDTFDQLNEFNISEHEDLKTIMIDLSDLLNYYRRLKDMEV